MSEIWICPLSEVEEQVRGLKPAHLVSLLDPGSMIGTPHGLHPNRHLRLECHDIGDAQPQMAPPGEGHAKSLIDLAGRWNESAPILVHCWAGVSRSTASAFIIGCARNPDADELELAQRLRKASPTAWPNRRLIGFADRMLGRDGRMIAAIKSIGEGDMMAWPEPFELAWR